MFDLWKRVGFELRKILIFLLGFVPLVNLLGFFSKTFLGSLSYYFCRVLSVLQLL
jgi:hypothetical protein